MVCGTGSDAGKSRIVAGLCRLLARRGLRVAPFKGQNMALNSAVTDDGGEIGRAQAAQAAAAGVRPERAMNPILLKPTGHRRSQVVVDGRAIGEVDAVAYQAMKSELRPVVRAALADLRRRFDVVVLEGAGSPAEINLAQGDLVNLGLASEERIPAVVVGDIDRGGVFAALYGTWALVDAARREVLRGFLINKFRGDRGLLEPGLAELERRTGLPVLGVLPWLEGLGLDAEDSLALERLGAGRDGSALWRRGSGQVESDDPLDVAVVRLPHLANVTDFDALRLEPGLTVRFVAHRSQLGDPDLCILPGTKATVADLEWLQASGLADACRALLRRRSVLLGICGGYQMLGRRIDDPIESGAGSVAGLGLLPVETVFAAEKLVCRRRGVLTRSLETGSPGAGSQVAPRHQGEVRNSPGEAGEARLEGYEIHHGRLRPVGPLAPFAFVEGPGSELVAEGAVDWTAGVLGTSLHGVFDHPEARQVLLQWVSGRRGRHFVASGVSLEAARRQEADRIADALEAEVDLEGLFQVIAGAGRP